MLVFLLLDSTPWWLSLVQRLVQAARWKGPVLAHCRVELKLGSLAGSGHAVPRGVTRGSCGLRVFRSLMVGRGCSCFVVWPQEFQHWSLQALGWHQVLVPNGSL